MKKGFRHIGATVLAITLAATMALGCATFKKVVRSVVSVATDLCWVVAAENTDKLGGMTPAAWCAIADNIEPFIQEVLAAKDAASSTTGLDAGDKSDAPSE